MIGFNFDDRIGYFPTDWSLEQLKDSGDFVSGSTPSTTNDNFWGGDIIWLVPSDLTALSDSTNYIFDSESKITIDGFNSCSTNMLPIGSLCLSSRATIGEAVIAGIELCTNQGFVNIIPNERHCALYLLYWVKKNKNYISRYAAGTTFLEIGRRTFRNLKIALPKELSEQKAIAGILSKVDEAIEALGNSIRAAERLKKSLMQNLLTGNLKPDGTWRSKDEFYVDEKFGKVPMGWRWGRLSEIADIIAGQSPSGEFYNDVGNGTPMLNGPTEFTVLHPVPVQWTSKVTKLCSVGDILFTVRGSSTGRMNIADQTYCIGRGIAAIRNKEDSDIDFIYYTLITISEKILAEAKGAGTTFPNVSRGELLKKWILIPKTGQTDIASKIKEMDYVAKQKQSKINSLKTLKKSLIQNLLTGKVRVDVDKINKLLEGV
jgi:type I restriction enzyme S subunit